MSTKLFVRTALACLFFAVSAPAVATVSEPKIAKSQKALKAGEGAVRISIRSQLQHTESLFVHFVKLDDQGKDSEMLIRLDRGAGVPLMGSNMIDVKSKVYRLPAGQYRLLGFSIACAGVPFKGASCVGSFGGELPAGAYSSPSPTFTVEAGRFTEAGDFIAEYAGPDAGELNDLMRKGVSNMDYAMRWRPLTEAMPKQFTGMQKTADPEVATEFTSKITCAARPKEFLIQFPFKC
jgi:hypothetical protein